MRNQCLQIFLEFANLSVQFFKSRMLFENFYFTFYPIFSSNKFGFRKIGEKVKRKISDLNAKKQHAIVQLADIKWLYNLTLLKSKTKHGKYTKCPCRLCKTYLKDFLKINSKWDKCMKKTSTFNCKLFYFRCEKNERNSSIPFYN